MQFDPAHAEDFNDLQRVVDGLFAERQLVERLDVVVQADIMDLSPDMQEIVRLVPSGTYDRQRLCDMLNSTLAAHGWGMTYGMLD